ncbi:MAG: hypothetical protein IE916_00260 [Epsilonproteobacteria bacterium]|nr:hypothetical protein [Campylobacterota bacterium]
MARLRKGFSLLELGISLILIALLYIGVIRGMNSAKESRQAEAEFVDYDEMERGVKQSFVAILDAFEPICSDIPADTTLSWGWQHNDCKMTSPYPVYSDAGNDRKITYSIQFNSLTAAEQGQLENTIIENYNGVCSRITKTATALELRCPKILDVLYSTGGAYTRTGAHVANTDIDPRLPPSVRINYDRRSTTGTFSAVSNYEFTMNNVFDYRRRFSHTKINRIKDTLKSFHETKLLTEFNAPPPGALHSMDDEFVPWFWEAFGDDAAQVTAANCAIAGGSCTNLNTDNIWRTTDINRRALYWRRMVQNLFMGDTSVTVDGFGNGLFFVPFMSQCINNNIDSCVIVAPTLPQDNFITAGNVRPPHTSVIYSSNFNLKDTAAPTDGRTYFTY